MKIIGILQKIRLSFFTKIFLFIILTISAVIFISTLSSQYYINYMENKIKDRYTRSLAELENILDNHLSDTFNDALNLVWNEQFQKIRMSKKEDFKEGHGIFYMDSFIHDAFFINNNKNYVVLNKEVKNMDDFFKYHYPGIKIEDIPILNKNNFFSDIVSMEFKMNELAYATVFPYFIMDHDPNCRILINIDLQKITYFMRNYKLTDNSNIMIIDEHGNILTNTDYAHYPNVSLANNFLPNVLPNDSVFNPMSKNYISHISDETVMGNIKKGKNLTTHYFKEKRMIISKISKLPTKKKIYYSATIPYRDIYPETYRIPLGTTSFLISIVCLFFSLIFAFLISKNLYNPVKKILGLFKIKNYKNIKDEFTLITENIKNILNTNIALDQKFNNALPMIIENYFFKILSGNLNLNEKEFIDFLKKNNINFKNNLFLSVILRIYFDSNFYENFNHEKLLEIINKIFKLLYNSFSVEFNCYILKISKNEFCLIINLDDLNLQANIVKKLEYISKIFAPENNYFKILSGVGRIHEGLSGLKTSYEEALESLSSISIFDKQIIKEYDEIKPSIEQYDFSIKDENILLNLINCGLEKKAIDFFREIVTRNYTKNISITFERELYIRIYNTCINCISIKDSSISELMGDDYIDILKKYTQLSNYELSNYIIKIIKSIIRKNQYRGKFEINDVVEYINMNIASDISFDMIADKFNISASHLSRLLKKFLGLSYQEYLNICRINKAKKLLNTTSMSLNDISKECGFNSRFTFIRMFRKTEMVNPTRYRMIEKNTLIYR